MPTNKETISFTNQTTIAIPWTAPRIAQFGIFPEVEVYVQDNTGTHYKATVQPYTTQPPATFTQLNIDLPGPSTGFISIM
jgi:hypothetical protein